MARGARQVPSLAGLSAQVLLGRAWPRGWGKGPRRGGSAQERCPGGRQTRSPMDHVWTIRCQTAGPAASWEKGRATRRGGEATAEGAGWETPFVPPIVSSCLT